MDEKELKVVVFVGRTAGGFIGFLKENNLNPIEPEILAEYVRRGIINFEHDDRVASNRLLNEVWNVVGVQDEDLVVEVTRQFGKLCDLYHTLLQELAGDVKLSEALERDV